MMRMAVVNSMDARMTKPFDFDKLKKCMSEIKQS